LGPCSHWLDGIAGVYAAAFLLSRLDVRLAIVEHLTGARRETGRGFYHYQDRRALR
jgi:hypothetical protein